MDHWKCCARKNVVFILRNNDPNYAHIDGNFFFLNTCKCQYFIIVILLEHCLFIG